MFEILRKYSPTVEATSIDEGYVDLSGTLRMHKAPPWAVAHRMLMEIRSRLKINVSGGIAGSKSAAKMTTGLAKPNGLLYLRPDRAFVILRRLPVKAIPGVGKRAEELLKRSGILTVGDLADSNPERVKSLLGRWGTSLLEIACGRDQRPVESEARQPQKSYSKDRTLARDTNDQAFLRFVACELAEKLTAKLRSENKAAATVSLRVRYSDFSETIRSRSLKEATNENKEIVDCLERLFADTVKPKAMVRLVGVKLSGIAPPSIQRNMFDDTLAQRLQRDHAVDFIRDRFGFEAIRTARWEPGGAVAPTGRRWSRIVEH